MSTLTAFAGTVPANYDLYLGPILFEPYALDVRERLKGHPLKNVLELACGTGRVTRHLAHLLMEGGQLVATDLNPDMLAHAQSIITNPKIKWAVADAQELPFEEDLFDHIVCQFGVMFFTDKPKAFREVYRVLQPGGTFLFNVWDELVYNPRVSIIKRVMDDIFKEDAPSFLKKGPYSYFDKDEIRDSLTNAGFRNVRIDAVEKQGYYSSPDDLIKGFVDGSPLSEYMRDKPASIREALRSKLREELTIQAEQYGAKVPLNALVIEAEK